MSQTDRLTGYVGSVGVKNPCDCASFAPLVLAGEQVVDGVQTANSRVMVAGQANSATNGIYVSDSGNWSMALDFSGAYNVANGTLVRVTGGGANKGIYVVVATNPVLLGTTAIAFQLATQQFGSNFTSVNTMAALKALAPGAYPLVQMLGFNAAGDGGAGLFYWNAGDVTADNGGTIIQPGAGGNGRWRKL